MTGSTLGAAPGGGLLAKKGTARPAMRRQSQVQQAGFGSGNGGGLSGWLTGAEDDCGWNDMGDGAPTPNYGARSAIGLTAMSDTPDSLYVKSSPDDPDWDEADSYDDDSADWNAAAVTWQPTPPANPVGALQERLQAAAAAPEPASQWVSEDEPYELSHEQEVPVGLLGSIRAAWARFVAIVMGRGPITVLHLDPALRERLRNAAYRDGIDETELAERAIHDYLGSQSSNVSPGPASGMWN